MTARYALMSTRNVYRNVRFLVLTVALPLLLFLLYVNLYKGEDTGNGISVVAYLMVSMASFGCIGAAINTGARIAVERQTGWNRQLRLTALPARGYLVAKAVVSMLVTLPALVLVFIAGFAFLTVAFMVEEGGLTIDGLLAIFILVLVGVGVIGALRNPPRSK